MFTAEQKASFAPEFVDFLFAYQDATAEQTDKYRLFARLESQCQNILHHLLTTRADDIQGLVPTCFRDLFDEIVVLCPPSASRTAALRSCLLAKMLAVKASYTGSTDPKKNELVFFAKGHLQSAVLQANFAISHDGAF